MFLDKKQADKIRKAMLINGALNAKIVGQSAFTDRKDGWCRDSARTLRSSSVRLESL